MHKSKIKKAFMYVLTLVGIMVAMQGKRHEVYAAESEAAYMEREEFMTAEKENAAYKGDGYTCQIAWCTEENAKIFGRLYLPGNFEKTKCYKTAIMCHGGKLTCDFWDKYYAPELAKNGYVAYVFDCRSGTKSGRGSYSTSLEGAEPDAVSYAKDLNAALDYMLAKEYVDKNGICLVGQSLGGIAVQSVAAARAEEIAGLVVIYGGLSDNLSERLANYDEVKANSYNNGEVLFVQGTKDSFNTTEDILENMQWYDLATFVLMDEAPHGFGYTDDRPSRTCMANILEMLKRMGVEEMGE